MKWMPLGMAIDLDSASNGDKDSVKFEQLAERVGIRTHGRHEAHNGFRDRPIQPLWHLSGFGIMPSVNGSHVP